MFSRVSDMLVSCVTTGGIVYSVYGVYYGMTEAGLYKRCAGLYITSGHAVYGYRLAS